MSALAPNGPPALSRLSERFQTTPIRAVSVSDRRFRNSTMRALPDFLIIGASKCGTTTLFDRLARHTAVRMASIKEPCYFSLDEQYAKGPDWYASLFEGARPEQKCGEASTSYTRWPKLPHVPVRIRQANPEARLIYIMRDPVKRAESLYAYRMRRSATMSFEEHLEQNPALYLDAGRYADQIDHYLKVFNREYMLFLLLEDLQRDPCEVLNKVQEFLDLPVRDLTADGDAPSNVGMERRVRWRTTRRLRRVPGASTLLDATPASWRRAALRAFCKTPIGRRIESVSIPASMTEATRRQLAEHFADSNRRLAQMLGRDLSHWTTSDG